MCYRENFPSSSCFIAFAEIIQIPSKILRGEEDDFLKILLVRGNFAETRFTPVHLIFYAVETRCDVKKKEKKELLTPRVYHHTRRISFS